jgi:hypothetical protein
MIYSIFTPFCFYLILERKFKFELFLSVRGGTSRGFVADGLKTNCAESDLERGDKRDLTSKFLQNVL